MPILLSVRILRIMYKVLNFELLLLSSIDFTYFPLQPSELNDMINFPPPPQTFFSDFLIGKCWGRLTFGVTQYMWNISFEVFTAVIAQVVVF
jgi:hypothetical protein